MTHGTAIHPATQAKTCSTCPYFNNYIESDGKGWCNLFNHQARKHHRITNDCVISSDLAISYELENNLSIFPNVNLDELEVFPTEEIEDELDKPYSEYEVGSVIKVIDEDEAHEEWGVFEIVECKYNESLYRNTESYLNESLWYFKLASNDDATQIDKSLWVREDEICHFEQSCNVCTEDIF